MNCQAIRARITARNDITTELAADEAAHLSECELCRHWYSDFQLDHALEDFSVPEPDCGFADRVIAKASAAERNWFNAPRLAMAASVAVISLAIGLLLGQGRPTEAGFEVAMAPYEDRVVDVVIEAVKARKGVTLTVAFADELELPGRPNQRSLTWTTDLEQGKNLLKLPIRLMGTDDSYFTVQMARDGTERVLRVDVRAEDQRDAAISV